MRSSLKTLTGTALLAGLAACSAGLAASNGTHQVVVQSGDLKNFTAFTFAVTPEDRVVPTSLPTSADRAWTATEQAFQGMGLAITRLDAPHHVIGSQPALTNHRLLGDALSTFVDCGVNAARAPIVNSYTVTMAVTTQVVALGDSSRLETLVQARAQDPVHNNPAVSCSSTGKLEGAISTAVRARTGQ